jgi:hypothetical protein
MVPERLDTLEESGRGLPHSKSCWRSSSGPRASRERLGLRYTRCTRTAAQRFLKIPSKTGSAPANQSVMRTLKAILQITLGAAICAVSIPNTLAVDSWATADYVDIPGVTFESMAIATAPPAKVFVVYEEFQNSAYTRVVRKSTDSGSTWEVAGRAPVQQLLMKQGALVINSAGHLFILSEAGAWVVQRSVDEGDSWQVIDDWQYTPGLYSQALAIAIDDADNLYVSGHGQRADGNSTWFVRRSSDGGQTWQLVDEWRGFAGVDAGNSRWAIATPGGVFVLGAAYAGGDQYSRYLRRSTDRGSTWETIAEFPIWSGVTGIEEQIFDLKANAAGHLYALCFQFVTDGSAPSRLYFRRSTDGGVNWETFPHLPYDVGTDWRLEVGLNGRLIASGPLRSELGWEPGWPMLTSDDGGVSWTKSNDFEEGNIYLGHLELASDPAGNFFAIAHDRVEPPGWRLALIIRRLSAVPTIPTLQMEADVSGLRLFWPANMTGFTPQSATTFADGGDWLDLGAVPTLEGDRYEVTVERESTGPRFFRLRKP